MDTVVVWDLDKDVYFLKSCPFKIRTCASGAADAAVAGLFSVK